MTETFSCEILEENLKLKADNAALLARCDLLEAELCRYQREIEVIIMAMEG